ncbi:MULTISPECIES: DUF2523 family protein [Neisseria]|jgi:putative membrane protein|nr:MULTISPECIES: DUF2523 family protein [Neisseria]DAP91810.1 MAG TPA: Minor Head Virion Protein G6P [Inoviridae sp.]OFM29348.1 hypothetical protein HMPREF2700_04740 [Neisseria sp. HMSC068C04]OHP62178.1 hypothetical protein HMPREF2675_10560 [Neisseria sp. HMSC061H08]OHQ15429.1 hypothetical protein HMPREF2557_02095 [Neisseria sp. HMSC064F03]UTG67958.1 DUF2523 domain-containing protein [Neisseria subflava]
MWAKLLTSVLTTVAGKIMSAVGLSFITYVGLDALQNQLMQAVSQQVGGLTEDSLQVLYILGIGVCLNWIFGTFTFIASLKTMSKLSAIMASK